MQITTEQKERLEQAGWEIIHTTPSGRRTYLKRDLTEACVEGEGVTFKRPYEEAKTVDMAEVLEVAAILGIAPAGYRLVREDMLRACHTSVKAIGDKPDAPMGWMDSICLSAVEAGLASMLGDSTIAATTKEGDKDANA